MYYMYPLETLQLIIFLNFLIFIVLWFIKRSLSVNQNTGVNRLEDLSQNLDLELEQDQ
jgi:hypothetical protein